MRVCPLVTAAIAAVALIASCTDPSSPALPSMSMDGHLDQLRSELDAEFVVFAEPRLVIRAIGAPIAAPVTVGSRPSPATLRSEDTSVVVVDSAGNLIARQPGRTRIVAPHTGSTIEVEVAPPDATFARLELETQSTTPAVKHMPGPVVIRPRHPRVRKGELMSFQALSRGGPLYVDWTTSDERVVEHIQEQLFRAEEPGEALVCASIAQQKACTPVRVTP